MTELIIAFVVFFIRIAFVILVPALLLNNNMNIILFSFTK